MSKKEFDKNEFKKSQDKMALIFLILFIMGIISAICGLFVGDYAILGGDCSGCVATTDPADYYGKYYTEMSNGVTVIFEFDETECTYIETNGVKENKKYYEYEYVSAANAQRKFPNETYEGCDAIVVYLDSSYNNGIVLWIIEGGEGETYTFRIGATDQTVKAYETNEGNSDNTNQEPEEDGDNEENTMQTPDYYGTYRYDSENYITFYEDGTAILYDAYGITYLTCEFVSAETIMDESYASSDYVIAVYNDSDAMYFEYYTDYLALSGYYRFYKD